MRTNFRVRTGRQQHARPRAFSLALATAASLSACRDGTGTDDGGDTPSSIGITVAAAPVIGDTLRVTAVARNRGGRELPNVQPAVRITIAGRAVELISGTTALAIDTGRVTISAASGAISAEQVLTVGMPASFDIAFTAPDSVRLGDSLPPLALDVRRNGVLRRDLRPLVTSSDTFTVLVTRDGPNVDYRLLKPGTVTLTATLGTRTVARSVRVNAARISSMALAPTPSVLDVGDVSELRVAAFDVQGAAVDTSEMQYAVLSGPGTISGRGLVRATAPGRIVVQATARGAVREDTVEVMPASSFTLSVRPGVGPDGVVATIPPRLQVAIDRAVKRWRQVIRDDLPPAPLKLTAGGCRNPDIDEVVSGVVIHVRVPPLGFGGVLAQATACILRPDARTIQGFMEFNSDVLDRIADDALFYVAAHEIGHVLGIGTVWYRPDGLPSLVSGRRFTGAEAITQFNLLDNRAAFTGLPVPLSNDGGHWSPSVLMMEVMEPVSRATTRFSRLTVGAMADMGYVVNARSWDRFALSLSALRVGPMEPEHDLRGDVLPPFGVVRADGSVVPFR